MIFGDSDEEGTKDIDFLDIDEDDEESDEVNSESGNEGASDSDSEEEEEWWTTDLSNIVVDKFSAQSGIVVKMGVNPKADDFFGLMFDEDLFEKIKEETHHYACMMFANPKWKLTLWVIMGMHILLKVADYWSTDIFQGNEGIKRVMPKIQFEEISHLNNLSQEPAQGDVNFNCLYKCCPALNTVLRNIQCCSLPTKNLLVDEGMIAFKG